MRLVRYSTNRIIKLLIRLH